MLSRESYTRRQEQNSRPYRECALSNDSPTFQRSPLQKPGPTSAPRCRHPTESALETLESDLETPESRLETPKTQESHQETQMLMVNTLFPIRNPTQQTSTTACTRSEVNLRRPRSRARAAEPPHPEKGLEPHDRTAERRNRENARPGQRLVIPDSSGFIPRRVPGWSVLGVRV